MPDIKTDAAIIGGGPAGLAAAEILSGHGIAVHVFDAMPSLGRKLLMAGKSGLNLTHAEPYENFGTRFGAQNGRLRPYLDQFTPSNLISWAEGLGIETFVGSSGRIFPTVFKASPLLRAWLRRLDEQGVSFYPRHKWLGWDTAGHLCFSNDGIPISVEATASVFALGGASWPRLGSDAAWVPPFQEASIEIAPFKPANCGFLVNWSADFTGKFAGEPVKSVRLSHGDETVKGDFVISRNGIEGSAVYAISSSLRDTLLAEGQATLLVDLKPDLTIIQLAEKLSRPRGKNSMSNHLRKTAGIKGVQAALIRECLPKDILETPERLAAGIKAVPVPVMATRPMEEAISCAGGVSMDALDDHLMTKAKPGVFCAGEMLDWEAPTGGYLLTACFATGRAAGLGALSWIRERS